MKCSKCRLDNPQDAKFCNGCGSKLERPCLHCGKANPPGSRFCNECGQKLEEEEAVEKERLSLEGERKQVTVLFSDLLGLKIPLILESWEPVLFRLPSNLSQTPLPLSHRNGALFFVGVMLGLKPTGYSRWIADWLMVCYSASSFEMSF